MNRALYIVLIPTLLVAVGYAYVLHEVGVRGVFPRLIVALVLFLAGLWWLARRNAPKTGHGKPQ
jgi:hypothetical protein